MNIKIKIAIGAVFIGAALLGSFFSLQNKIYQQNLALKVVDKASNVQVKPAIQEKEELGHHFSRQGQNIFYYSQIISGVDVETFQVIRHADDAKAMRVEMDYAKDKKNIYDGGDIVAEADQNTFEQINGSDSYWKDKNSVYVDYFGLHKIQGANLDTFKVISFPYAKDVNNVYYSFSVIEKANPGYFKVLNSAYSKDNSSIFCISREQMPTKLAGVNFASFKVLGNFAQDNQNVFFNCEVLFGADSNSFMPLKAGYSRDKNSVYYRSNVIKEADVKTFEVVEGVGVFAKDKSHTYKEEKVLNQEIQENL